jgi:hypothetical protein
MNVARKFIATIEVSRSGAGSFQSDRFSTNLSKGPDLRAFFLFQRIL